MRHLLLATTLLLAVACGGGDDDDGNAQGGGAPVTLPGPVNDHGTRDAGDTADVTLDEFFFEPTFLRVAPKATVTLRLKNVGDTAHTFTATALGVDETLQPGTTAETSVTLPAAGAGAVRFFCRFHESQGMQGAFFFERGDTVAPGGGTPGGGTPGGGTPGGGTTQPADGDGAYNQ